MSAPNTDLEKQAKRHRGPLRGMFAVVLFALVLLALLAFWAFGRGGDPEGAEVQIEATTGDVVVTDDASDGITANDVAEEEADSAAATEPAGDPNAVEVPSITVTSPQTGQTDDINPLTGGTDAAEPIDPIGEEEPLEGQ